MVLQILWLRLPIVHWNGSYYFISKNDGSDFYSHNLANYPIATHQYYVADFNGDGRTDFLCTDGEPPWWNGYQMYRSGSKNNILLKKQETDWDI